MKKVYIYVLGGAFLISFSALLLFLNIDTDRLKLFGPTAQIYFIGIEKGFMISSIILFLALVAVIFFKKQLTLALDKTVNMYRLSSERKKRVIILSLCLLFSFVSHAPNIIHGYFNMDDFEIIGVGHTMPLREAIFVPHGNDHTIPLFRAEAKLFESFFGQSHVPWSIFVFVVFALIPFFTYLIFKRLGISTKNFLIFLGLFSASAGWTLLLSGFYIMSIYIQILFFFCAAIWAHTEWMKLRQKKYLLFFGLAITLALTTDISGLWVLPAVLLYIGILHHIEHDSLRLFKKPNFFGENLSPLLVFLGVSLAFGAFLIFTFTVVQPDRFLSRLSAEDMDPTFGAREKAENWRPLPLASNFLSFFANGVSLSTFAPNLVKILAHPAILEKIKPFWPFVQILVISLNLILLWAVYKKALPKERKIILFLAAALFVTISMVVIARPNHEVIPDFDYRYAGAPFYFYVIFLVMAASVFARIKKEHAAKILIPAVIITFSLQQVFAFHSDRIELEAKARKEAVMGLKNKLFAEFETLNQENEKGKSVSKLVVPNLSGEYISEAMPGFSLSHYLLFFDNKTPIKLVKNEYMPTDPRTKIDIVPSIRTATSGIFKEILKKPSAVRDYYTFPALLRYTTLDFENTNPKPGTKDQSIVLQKWQFDPEKRHTVELSFYTDDVPGNSEFSFSFDNDFDVKEKIVRLRIDDYTSHVKKDGKRFYRLQTDLLQIYVYALSERVSDLTLYVPETKGLVLTDAKLF